MHPITISDKMPYALAGGDGVAALQEQMQRLTDRLSEAEATVSALASPCQRPGASSAAVHSDMSCCTPFLHPESQNP